MIDDPEQPEWFNKIMHSQQSEKRASGSSSATGSAATDCAKCKTPMMIRSEEDGVLGRMKITGYLCRKCGHYNNLKRRKAWRQNDQALRAAK